jgi:hypothetical protein
VLNLRNLSNYQTTVYHLKLLPILPALLFSLSFILPAWWLWHKDRRYWSILPLVITLVLLGLTVALQFQDANRTQALHDVDILLAELNEPDLWSTDELTDTEDLVFLASSSSMALYRARKFAEGRRVEIDSTLAHLAAWVARDGKLKQWRNRRDWDRQVFFLAHAGAVLGHYQLATGDEETFSRRFTDIGEHLGKRLERGSYKHLISRPGEDFYRPADNAAALYTISLYDLAFGKQYLAPNFNDWSDYLKDELHYAESRLPCAAFSSSKRCQLEPNATATGMYIAYRAAAAPERVDDNIPWKEWTHYFTRTSLSPFSLSIRPNMRDGKETRFCDLGAAPLACEQYENAIGLWAASEYGGGYTYYRLFSSLVFQRWFLSPVNYAEMRPARRARRLTHVAIRTVGTSR